jgi:hypothetical protein
MKAAMPPSSTAPQINTVVGLSELLYWGRVLGSSATTKVRGIFQAKQGTALWLELL